MTNSIKFSDSLYLSSQSVSKAEASSVVKHIPTNHIVIIDCSGSMYSELPLIRQQLKNKLPSLVREDDTVTLMWFSGRGDFGVIQEAIPVRNVKDLSTLNVAIDRFLRPVGLTGFKEPLDEALNVIERIQKTRPNTAFNLFFMTDGYDNQWNQRDILASVSKLTDVLASGTFVEYGWNAHRELLSKMAEAIGGNLVFSEHFSDYETVFEAELGRANKGGKKTKVTLDNKPALDYAFSYSDDGSISTYTIEDGTVTVPENLSSLFYLSSTGVAADGLCATTPSYYALATLSQRMKANEIFTVLASMGDVYLVNRFVNAFSKQDYTDFENECKAQALDPVQRFRSGIDYGCVPKEDAYTVLNLLDDLTSDEDNLIYPRHSDFGYQRIGAATQAKDDSVKFEHLEPNPGVSMLNVVFNNERPNASIRVQFTGTVTLPKEKSEFPKLSNVEAIPSFIYRNYTIIRDGIVHTRKLPVSLTEPTLNKLSAAGVNVTGAIPGELFVLDISTLPVINRQMVKNVSAKETFTKVFELEKLKGDQKVFNFYRTAAAPKKSEGFSILYGEDAAVWLKTLGLTDYNGFNPPSEKVDFGDVYTAKVMDISVAKLSSLPKVEDVAKVMESGKTPTLSQSVMIPAIQRVREFQASTAYTTATDKDALFATWLKSEANAAITKTRELNNELAKIKFAIIVGHVWFSDLTPGEGTLVLTLDGQAISVTAKLEDKEIS